MKLSRTLFKNSLKSSGLRAFSDLNKYSDLQRTQMGEGIILVNSKDKVLDPISKYDGHRKEYLVKDDASPHRAFSVFWFNDQNELLMQQRSSDKITFPDLWTNSCCSHPLFTEDEVDEERNLGIRRAAIRRMGIELGTQKNELTVEDFSVLGRILYKAIQDDEWGEYEIDYILFLKKNLEFEFNHEEIRDVKWLSQDQLREDLQNPDYKFTPWFKLITQTKLFDWWNLMIEDRLEEAVDMEIQDFTKEEIKSD